MKSIIRRTQRVKTGAVSVDDDEPAVLRVERIPEPLAGTLGRIRKRCQTNGDKLFEIARRNGSECKHDVSKAPGDRRSKNAARVLGV